MSNAKKISYIVETSRYGKQYDTIITIQIAYDAYDKTGDIVDSIIYGEFNTVENLLELEISIDDKLIEKNIPCEYDFIERIILEELSIL